MAVLIAFSCASAAPVAARPQYEISATGVQTGGVTHGPGLGQGWQQRGLKGRLTSRKDHAVEQALPPAQQLKDLMALLLDPASPVNK